MRERWTLFIGAALTVCLGVALVQSSLLLLISAATMTTPAGMSPLERAAFEDRTSAAVPLLGVTLGVAAFLAVFIISSTFAFTVEQRRRDLALRRLTGASRGQVRRMLTGEAVLLGLFGAAAGVPAGLAVMAMQAVLLRELRFVPEGFTGQWRMWILGVSAGTGVALAVGGVLTAARRGSRVRPLEALRETGGASRVMTAGRWLAGLFFLGGTIALVIVAPVGGPGGGAAMAANVPMCAAVALAAFGPLLVPALARLLPIGLGGTIGALARANLVDGRRRSASVAAPVIVLAGLVLGQAGANTSFTAAGIDEQRRDTVADLVAVSAATLPAVPGVAWSSAETTLPVQVTWGSGEEAETETMPALAVDPAAYVRVHPRATNLRGVTAGPGGDLSPGTTVRLRAGDTDLGSQRVTTAVPVAMSGGASLLLPYGLVPPALLADAPRTTFVTLDRGADRAAVRAALVRAGATSVSDRDAWLTADAAARDDVNTKITTIILGLGGLYALIGVINAVVIAAAARRREFAEARVTGLTRGQVIRAALLESSAVTTAGLLLGGVAAGATYVAVLSVTRTVTGHAVLDLPWPLIAALVAGTFLVTGVTSLLTSAAATHPRPIALLGARE